MIDHVLNYISDNWIFILTIALLIYAVIGFVLDFFLPSEYFEDNEYPDD